MKRSLLSLGLFLSLFTASQTTWADRASGGGDDVEAQFNEAKKALRDALDLKTCCANMSLDHIKDIKNELDFGTIEFDHTSEKPFEHMNGSKTWIKSNRQRMGTITILSKVYNETNPQGMDVFKRIAYLGHEIGHSLYAEGAEATAAEEKKSWDLGFFLAGFVKQSQQASTPFPFLVPLVKADFTRLPDELCYQKAHVEANPQTGVVNVTFMSGKYGAVKGFFKSVCHDPVSSAPRTLSFQCEPQMGNLQLRTICNVIPSTLSLLEINSPYGHSKDEIESAKQYGYTIPMNEIKKDYYLEIFPDGGFMASLGHLYHYINSGGYIFSKYTKTNIKYIPDTPTTSAKPTNKK